MNLSHECDTEMKEVILKKMKEILKLNLKLNILLIFILSHSHIVAHLLINCEANSGKNGLYNLKKENINISSGSQETHLPPLVYEE